MTSGSGVKESWAWGLEKKTTVSESLAESSNFRENKTKLLSSALILWTSCVYLGLITLCPEISHPLHLPRTYPCPEDLSLPAQNLPPHVQLKMPSQLEITQNVPPD